MKNIIVALIIFVSCLVYLPSLNHFFFSDDFYNLKVSQITKLSEIPAFFSFFKNDHTTNFYRPLSTQVFFSIFYPLFGFNPPPYRLFVLLIFALNAYLAYYLSQKITQNYLLSLLVLFFYTFSVTHFVRIYYLSALCELFVSLFFLLSTINWFSYLSKSKLQNYFLTVLFYILALFSKESAVTLPFLAFLISVTFYKKLNLKLITPLLFLNAVYLYFRLMYFGTVAGDSYLWDFSLKIVNTFSWYFAWSLGLPEMFLDYIGSKFAINPNLFRWYGPYAKIIIISFFSLILTSIVCLIIKVKSKTKQLHIILFAFFWFGATLVPVLFLPWHKFPLEQTIPLFGAALLLATIFKTAPRSLIFLGIICYLVLNLTSQLLTYKTHWSISRAKVTQRVFNKVSQEYPSLPPNTTFYFYNDSAYVADNWGASKQVSVALSGNDFFQLFYRNPDFKVYYEDYNQTTPSGQIIKLGTKEFLGY